jgi:hypothetical protein
MYLKDPARFAAPLNICGFIATVFQYPNIYVKIITGEIMMGFKKHLHCVI